MSSVATIRAEGDFDEVRRAITLGALVLVNAIPLLGVLFRGWDVGSIIILYWSENLVIGFYTLVKILARSPIGGLFTSVFFLVHYGGFCAVHGLFVLFMTQTAEPESIFSDVSWPFFFVFVEMLINVVRYVLSIAPPEWIIGFVALFVSHGLSLWLNYFRGGEFRGQTVKSLMGAPYKRQAHCGVARGAHWRWIPDHGSRFAFASACVAHRAEDDPGSLVASGGTKAPATGVSDDR